MGLFKKNNSPPIPPERIRIKMLSGVIYEGTEISRTANSVWIWDSANKTDRFIPRNLIGYIEPIKES